MQLRDDEIQRVLDYQHVFGGEQGQRVLEDLRKFCGVYRTSFTNDPYTCIYNEGRRDVVLRIERMVKLDSERVLASRSLGEDYTTEE